MLNTSLSIVCLPTDTPTDKMTAAAESRLADTARTGLGPSRYFLTRTRLRRRRLLQPWRNTAAGGAVHLLDLDAMRAAAQHLHWYRWAVWNQVVADTRPAQPYWTFLDRTLHDPKYPLSRAQQHYLAQPRIAAMRTYNALPHKVMEVPTSHLEAFQTGANAYACFGWLSAVPAGALVCLDGSHLTAATNDLATQLSYLEQANRVIAALPCDVILVAIGSR